MTTLLVTGASGKFGQRVLHHLLDTLHVPATDIIATSRNPDALRAVAERGVRVRRADFDDAAGLPKAFDGAQRLLLVSTDAVDRQGRRQEQHTRAIRAAETVGVQHLLYTSMPKPENSPLVIAPDHAGSEQAVRHSAIAGWTLLRNHFYFENLLFTLPGILANGGQWYSAAGEGRLANLCRDDLARAAAHALASPGETGRTVYTLSGEEALTTAEQAAVLSRVVGKPITVIPVTVEALIAGMVSAGVPEPMAQIVASFDANTAAGRVGEVTGDYRRLTGAAPQRFADWAAAQRRALQGA